MKVFSSAYSEKDRLRFSCGERAGAKQSFKDECDVNNIVRKYVSTGVFPPSTVPLRYGDASSVPDYQNALNSVIAAEAAFGSLSSSIRKRFSNSPASLMEFLADPGNRDEAVKLGLIEPPAPSSPQASPEGGARVSEAPAAPIGAAGGVSAGVIPS